MTRHTREDLEKFAKGLFLDRREIGCSCDELVNAAAVDIPSVLPHVPAETYYVPWGNADPERPVPAFLLLLKLLERGHTLRRSGRAVFELLRRGLMRAEVALIRIPSVTTPRLRGQRSNRASAPQSSRPKPAIGPEPFIDHPENSNTGAERSILIGQGTYSVEVPEEHSHLDYAVFLALIRLASFYVDYASVFEHPDVPVTYQETSNPGPFTAKTKRGCKQRHAEFCSMLCGSTAFSYLVVWPTGDLWTWSAYPGASPSLGGIGKITVVTTGFYFRDKLHVLGGQQLQLLRLFTDQPEGVSKRDISRTVLDEVEYTDGRVRGVVSQLRKNLRQALALGNFDPLPTIAKAGWILRLPEEFARG